MPDLGDLAGPAHLGHRAGRGSCARRPAQARADPTFPPKDRHVPAHCVGSTRHYGCRRGRHRSHPDADVGRLVLRLGLAEVGGAQGPCVDAHHPLISLGWSLHPDRHCAGRHLPGRHRRVRHRGYQSCGPRHLRGRHRPMPDRRSGAAGSFCRNFGLAHEYAGCAATMPQPPTSLQLSG